MYCVNRGDSAPKILNMSMHPKIISSSSSIILIHAPMLYAESRERVTRCESVMFIAPEQPEAAAAGWHYSPSRHLRAKNRRDAALPASAASAVAATAAADCMVASFDAYQVQTPGSGRMRTAINHQMPCR